MAAESRKGKKLFLPMKGKWYELVLSGEKTEEYRLLKPYWMTRIRKWIDANIPEAIGIHYTPDHGKELSISIVDGTTPLPIVFVNGYQKDARRFLAYCDKVEIRSVAAHSEWGEDEYNGQPHFVLHIGHIERGGM